MDELQQRIISLLEIAGGSLLYVALLGEMDAVERQHLRGTLLLLRDMKKIKQQVAWDAKTSTITHTIELLGG